MNFTNKSIHNEDELSLMANHLGRVFSFLTNKIYSTFQHSVVQCFLVETSKDSKNSQKILNSRKQVIETLISVGMLNILKSMDSKTVNEVFSSLSEHSTNEKNLLYDMKKRVSELKSYQ